VNALTDQQLLRDYSAHRTEAAFAELVRRHVDFVYSAAVRMVRDAHLAQDVTQGVFVTLAQNARQLTERPTLSGWLHRTAQNLAANVVRTDVRRRIREQEAVTMNELLSATPDASWEQISPELDAALGELNEPDRDALLLRYFERKSAQEMAQILGISDEAAQKRVNRAVDRLRELFSKRKITIGASGLVVLITANGVQAAPVGLAATLTALGLSTSAGTITATGSLGVLGQLAQIKTKVWLAATLVVGLAAFITYHSLSGGNPPTPSVPPAVAFATSTQILPLTTAPTVDATATPTEPDPLKLLKGVAQARLRIHSGTLEFQYSLERTRNGFPEKNQTRFVILFDGPKLRFESFGREYAYAFDADEAKQAEIIKHADSMNRESAISAGYTKPFASHHTMVREGDVVYNLWQTDDQRPSTTICAITNGFNGYIFDPRCLGLTTFLNVDSSVTKHLGFTRAEFLGEENVDGVPAYHVRIQFPNGEPLDYWMEKARPERLLQHTYGLDIVKSTYDESNPRDPIPVEVNAVDFRNGRVAYTTKYTRVSAQYNVPVDPVNFTLAGLGMPIGTDVSDDRIMRRIGYWTGSGLSDDLPSKKATNAPPAPKLDELFTILDNSPESPEALQSATWIILNTPDGAAVEKAAAVILAEHTRDTNLVQLCLELDRVRPRRAKELLATILQNNPSVEVQGNACFTLATLLKSEANFGHNKDATAQAIKQYERVIRDFRMVKQRGYSLAALAKPELSELQHLIIGQPAPATEGVDLNGQPMKLSDYRGKVTVLVFWSGHFTEEPDFHTLMDSMAGKPFALLGVNCDDDTTRKPEYFDKVTWPTFRDGRDGPIAKLWNVRSWPDTWVLDRQGVIRYRGDRGRALNDIVNALLLE